MGEGSISIPYFPMLDKEKNFDKIRFSFSKKFFETLTGFVRVLFYNELG